MTRDIKADVERVAAVIVGKIGEIPRPFSDGAVLLVCKAIEVLDFSPDECTADSLAALWEIRHEFSEYPLTSRWPILVHRQARRLL